MENHNRLSNRGSARRRDLTVLALIVGIIVAAIAWRYLGNRRTDENIAGGFPKSAVNAPAAIGQQPKSAETHPVGRTPSVGNPVPNPNSAIDFAARKKAYPYDYAAIKKLVMQKIRAKTPEIDNMISLLESRSPEKIRTALDLMVGKSEQDPAKRQETKDFYYGYLNGVLDFGDDSDKARAAEFLRALAAAAPLAGGREEVGRSKFFLRGNLEGAMIMTGEQESLAQSYMTMPPEQLEQWLLTTRVYAQLQPSAAH